MNTIDCSYRGFTSSLISVPLLGGMAIIVGRGLVTNRASVLHGIPAGAATVASTLFMWVMVVLWSVTALILAASFMAGVILKPRLILNDYEISAPRFGFSRTNTVVPFQNIHKLEVRYIMSARLLNIYHRDGRLMILEKRLPEKALFDKIYSELSGRINVTK